MLSIAIKNSVILALVILIAHFLLKNSAEDQESQRPSPVPSNGSPDPPRAAVSTSSQGNLGSDRVTRDSPKSPVMHGDDLYSYVYGQGQGAGQASMSLPKPAATSTPKLADPPTVLSLNEQIGGILVGYEGSGEQWADV